MKIHVFGDTGGHAKQLMKALTTVGVDLENFIIPQGTTILHLGDLIHKGPGSEYLISLVHLLMERNPGQWIQLLGNHEYQHVGGPAFWRCNCSPEMVMILRHWVEKGTAVAAFGADNLVAEKLSLSARDDWEPKNSSWVFTHAGVTRNFWRNNKSFKLASAFAEHVNSLPVGKITEPGKLLYGGVSNFNAGPVWAIASEEVYDSWTKTGDVYPPFNQAVGHTTAYSWPHKNWYGGKNATALKLFKENSKLNPEKRMVITKIGEQSLLLSLDPGFSTNADIVEQPHLTFTQWNI